MASPTEPSKSISKLTVYRGFDWPGRWTWSPFVGKLETRLRLAGVPYAVLSGSPRSAPTGKIPYADLGNGETIGDSTFIIRRLVDEGVLPDLNAGLTAAQRTQDLALRALMEDKLYFYGVRERWQDNYVTMRSNVMAAIPYPIQVVVGLLAYNKISGALNGQGTGRLTRHEVATLHQEGWEAIGAQLSEARLQAPTKNSDAPFWLLGGKQPTEADATLMGFIASAMVCTAAPEAGRIVRSIPVLVDYCERIHDRYFSDYEKWTESGCLPR
ncbi:hypothetical protein F4780DRAFT_173420 [Xylariomycetidae sp. FL0641]|nr:hypothetical protein F4780DRAFT_173420 [Xylariomycetidae sp. FL0641]